jgi:3-hydroxyacyl-CoA dehydrogenase / enoyl-CoA hydratase / 3-hydroxybutyryl-CoA epimerase
MWREGKPSRAAAGGVAGVLLDRNPLGRRLVYRGARAEVMKKTGGHYPAPLRALDVVRTSLEDGMEAGLKAEARAFGELAVSPVSRELVRIFFATTALKKDDGVAPGTAKPVKVTHLGVVGAGFMGSGVAGTAVTTARVDVRLKDTDLARIGKGLKAALDIVQGQLTRRRITKPEYEQLAALISGGTDPGPFARCQLVIEAVFEDVGVKRRVLAEAEAVLPAAAVFATNTSTIPIGRIAEGSRHPERVIGMHFFSPVDRMPLVEVIPAAGTGPDAVATTVRFGRALGKTVIVVADRPGFWVNRILSPYLIEAGLLLSEGVPIDVVDRALVEFGFPVGPFALLDEVGVDVAAKGGAVMHDAFGERMAPAPVIARLLEDGRLGKKAGKGLYLYHDGHKTDPDPKVYELVGVKPLAAAATGDIERRLVYAMLNEAARAMAEGVVRSPRDGDIGAIFGIGFPPFRGGPFRYVDVLGAPEVLRRTRSLEHRFGARFEPAPLLVEMARKARRFYS